MINTGQASSDAKPRKRVAPDMLDRIRNQRHEIVLLEHTLRAKQAGYELLVCEALLDLGANPLGDEIDETTGEVSPRPRAR